MLRLPVSMRTFVVIFAISMDIVLAIALTVTREVAAGELAAEAVAPDVDEAVAMVVSKVIGLWVRLGGAKCANRGECIGIYLSSHPSSWVSVKYDTKIWFCFEINSQNMVFFSK